MNPGKTIARATAIILSLSLLSRLFGVGREMAIAYAFGATGKTDAFLVSFIIPNLFYSVVGTALGTVIVPVFTEYAAGSRREEAWRVSSMVLNVSLVFSAFMALLGAAGAPLLSHLLGGGFSGDTLQLTTRLTALIMPAIVFMTAAGVFSGVLNANNVFGPPAAGPVMMNLMMIFGALIGGKFLGIYGLTAGAVAGAAVFSLVQLPALRYLGFKYCLRFEIGHPEVRRVFALALPVILASGIGQIYMMIDYRLASGLAEGSIAALNYANKLMNLPQGLLVTAVVTAMYPTLSRLIAEAKGPEMAATLRRGMKFILLLGIPGAVGMIVLRESIVALIFERGAFDARATAMTANALLFFAVGLAGMCLNLPLTRGFFAMQDTKTPLLISAVTIGVKLFFSLVLVRLLQHAGLALATSLTVLVNMFILSFLLQRRLPGLFERSFFIFSGGVVLASAVMGLAVSAADGFLAARFAGGGLFLTIRVGVDIVVGTVVFVGTGLALRLDELWHLLQLAYGFIQRRVRVSAS